MEKYKNKSKHFTSLEKKLFLDILKRYKHVIELKKSDSTTLKDKDAAWIEICKEYNVSQLITQERNVQQLKKFWANLKQNQREALTKEKQERMTTGGGPSIVSVEIDPDVSLIAPHLMKTAPVIYSSNLSDEELKKREKLVTDYMADSDLSNVDIAFEHDTVTFENSYDNTRYNDNNNEISDKENITPNRNKEKEIDTENASLQSSETLCIDTTPSSNNFSRTESKKIQRSGEKLSLLKRGKRETSSNNYENEISVKIQRIQMLFEQEMELNTLEKDRA